MGEYPSKEEFIAWWDRNFKGIDLESDPLRKSDMFTAWYDGAKWMLELLRGNEP